MAVHTIQLVASWCRNSSTRIANETQIKRLDDIAETRAFKHTCNHSHSRVPTHTTLSRRKGQIRRFKVRGHGLPSDCHSTRGVWNSVLQITTRQSRSSSTANRQRDSCQSRLEIVTCDLGNSRIRHWRRSLLLLQSINHSCLRSGENKQ